MNPVERQHPEQALPSEKEEDAYAVAFSEIAERSRLRHGLWAKAIAESGGDEKGAEVLYLRWRSGQLLSRSTEAKAQTSESVPSYPDTGAAQSTRWADGHEDQGSRRTGLLILAFISLAIIAAVWGSNRGESGSVGPTSGAVPVPEHASESGPAAVAAHPAEGTSSSSGATGLNLLVSAFASPGEALASPYRDQDWYACAKKFAESVVDRGGCQFSNSLCSRDRVSVSVSELRRRPTEYGTEFTLHLKGVDPLGSPYAENYACHLGRQSELLSFKEVGL